MTKQEAYNRIKSYFSLPGTTFGWDEEDGSCVYVARDGARCAIGVLIPEKEAFDELAKMCHGGVTSLTETLSYEMNRTDGYNYDPRISRAARRLYDMLGLGDKSMIDFYQGCQRIHDRHAEAFATQYVSKYSMDTTSVTPILGVDLTEAKANMLRDLAIFASDEGLVA